MALKNKNKIIVPNEFLFEQVLEYLQLGKYVTICVKGNSMRPSLREGDQVLLKPFESKNLINGLIVLAKVDDQMILHRVIRYNKQIIWLAGDNNLVQHEYVNHLDVVATAVSLYRDQITIKLNQRWQCVLGKIWYRARPIRRILVKLF